MIFGKRGDIIFWYITPREDLPSYISAQIVRKNKEGKLDEYTPEELAEMYKTLMAWEEAKARNLAIPNQKSFNFFLTYAMVKLVCGGNRAGKSFTCAMDVIMRAEGWHPLQRDNLEQLAVKGVTEAVKERV